MSFDPDPRRYLDALQTEQQQQARQRKADLEEQMSELRAHILSGEPTADDLRFLESLAVEVAFVEAMETNALRTFEALRKRL